MTDAPTASPASTVNPRERLGFVDALRGLFALFVVLHHSAMNVFGDFPVPVWLRWLTFGNYSVAGFLVVSGYSLAIRIFPLDRHPGWREFFKRRAVRILPAYYATLLLSTVLAATILSNPIGSHWDNALPLGRGSFILHLLMAHNLFTFAATRINYPLWSIATEFQVYAILPLFVLLYRRIGVGVAFLLTGMLATVPLFLVSHQLALEGQSTGFLHFGLFFLIGVGARAIQFSRLDWGFAAKVVMIAGASLAVVGGMYSYKELQTVWSLLAAVATGAALLVAARWEQTRQTPWGGVRLGKLGEFSYSLYLVHAPVIELVWRFVVRPLGFARTASLLTIVTLGTIASLLVAYGFYLLIERPVLRRALRKRLSPEPAAR